MATLVVRIPGWLVATHVLGESVSARWQRRGSAAGFDHIVFVDALGAAPDAGEGAPGDMAVDGGALDLDLDLARDAVGRGVVVQCPAGDARPGPVVAAAQVRDLGAPLRGSALPAWTVSVRAPADLAGAEAFLASQRREALAAAGVRIVGDAAFVAPTARIAAGATLWGDVVVLGDTVVGPGAVIHPGCHLTDATVDTDAVLRPYTVVEGARIGTGCVVGPFAHLRPGTVLEQGARVGNFVETKAAHLGAGAKANHLTYLGDCAVGAGANIGAGTITCNYDGARKHRTEIGAGAFIGSNTALVAPVRVGASALVAAGSVITDDVPDDALAIARGRQRTLADRGAAALAANRAARDAERAR